MDDPKKNPLNDDSLAAESIEGADDASVLPSRLDRYAKAHQRTVQMVDYANLNGEVKLADRLAGCGNYLLFRDYYTVGKVRLHAAQFCCKHLLCPLCAVRRASKMVKAYMDRLQVLKGVRGPFNASLVTLTVKDGEDLSERCGHLFRSVQKLHKARSGKGQKSEASKAFAAVWSYEFKRGSGSGLWHPHMHAVWLHDAPLDSRVLSQQWHDITGDSFIVDITPFYDQENVVTGFLEVFKYAMKFSDMSLEDNWEGFEVLGGKRLIASFGAFRGLRVPEDLLDEPLDELPYIEHFYRYLQNIGYALQERGQWHPK